MKGMIILGIIYSAKNKIKRLLAVRNPAKYARSLGVTVGDNNRFNDVPDFGTEPWLISIGDRTVLCSKIVFITHDGSIYAMKHLTKEYPKLCKFGKIEIGNECFIGKSATILPNVKIGNNCIVAANSVVSKDVPDGMVVGGCPAKPICTIEELANKWIDGMADYVPLEGENDFRVWTKHVADYYWEKKSKV